MNTQVKAWMAIFVSGISIACAQEPLDGLRAYWSFDGNLSEKLAGYHAADRGSARASYTLGHSGQALRVDGSRDLVEVAARNDRAFDNFRASISLWVKIEESGTILDKGSCSWSLSYTADGALEFGAYWGVDSYDGHKSLPGLGLDDGAWHHIVCAAQATKEGPIFVDGQPVDMRSQGVVAVQGSRFPLSIGGHPERSRKHGTFVGAIDELMVWDRSLTITEAEFLWNDGCGVTLSDILPDSDADGIPDAWEARHGLNIQLADQHVDPDGDGLSNQQEYHRGTHPRRHDTDRDGLSDSVETDTGVWTGLDDSGTSPIIADTDGDGLKDSRENPTGNFLSAWELGTDPLNADTDGDGFKDGGEVRLGSDPTDRLAVPSLAQNLTAYHPFNSSLLNQQDDQTLGEWLGGLTYEPAAFGDGLVFDGESAVILPMTDIVEGPFTVSFWYQIERVPDVTFGFHSLVSYNAHNPWRLDYQASASGHLLGRGIAFRPETEAPLADSVLTTERDREWHHLVAAYDPQTDEALVYLDGMAQPTGTERSRHPSFTAKSELLGLMLGGIPSQDGKVSEGLIGGLDDLAIWNRILDPVEIEALHTEGTANLSLGGLLAKQEATKPVDQDQDGLPDRWETAVGLQATLDDTNADLDGDGLSNADEYEARTHPGKADTDDDGAPDATETQSGLWVSSEDRGTDPNQSDSDGDGLLDGQEQRDLAQGSDPNSPDTDGDGISDGKEISFNSDPSDPASTPGFAAGLVAYLPLEETLTDVAGRGSAQWSQANQSMFDKGKFGQSASFQRSSIALQGGAKSDTDFNTDTFSVSLWFQRLTPSNTSANAGVLLGQGDNEGWEVRVHSFNEIRVDAHAGFVGYERVDLNPESFNHLVFIVNRASDRTSLYLNGVKLTPASGLHASNLRISTETQGEPIRIGDKVSWTNADFHGLIDDVAIWNRGLAEQEIATLFESGQSLEALAGLRIDTDSDGMPDIQERFAGTDPAQSGDLLQISDWQRIPEGISLTWPSQADRHYHVEYTPTLTASQWLTITPAPVVGGNHVDEDPARITQASGYYRVVVAPSLSN